MLLESLTPEAWFEYLPLMQDAFLGADDHDGAEVCAFLVRCQVKPTRFQGYEDRDVAWSWSANPFRYPLEHDFLPRNTMSRLNRFTLGEGKDIRELLVDLITARKKGYSLTKEEEEERKARQQSARPVDSVEKSLKKRKKV